jgi:hypothetical protein
MLKRFGVLGLVMAGAMLLQPAATFAEGLHHTPAFHDNGRAVTKYRSDVRVVKKHREPVRYRQISRKHKFEQRDVRFHQSDYRR